MLDRAIRDERTGRSVREIAREFGCSSQKNRAQSEIGDRSLGELRVVAITCNPAPDAKDRLRRLFTPLLEHTAGERQTRPPADATYSARSARAVMAVEAHAAGMPPLPPGRLGGCPDSKISYLVVQLLQAYAPGYR